MTISMYFKLIIKALTIFELNFIAFINTMNPLMESSTEDTFRNMFIDKNPCNMYDLLQLRHFLLYY